MFGVGTNSAAFFSGLGSTSVVAKAQQFPKPAGVTLAGMPGNVMQEAKRAVPAKAAARKPAQVKTAATSKATEATSSQPTKGASAQAKKDTGKR